MGHRALAAAAGAALVVTGLAGACSSFDDASSPSTDGGPATDGPSDGPADASAEDGAKGTADADAALVPPVELARLPNATAIAVRADDVFVGLTTGSIVKVSLTIPDAGTTLVTSKPSGIASMALTDDSIVWSDGVKERGRVNVTSSSTYGLAQGNKLRAVAAIGSTRIVSIQSGTVQNEVREYDEALNPGTGYGTYVEMGDIAVGGGFVVWTAPTTGNVYRAMAGAGGDQAPAFTGETGCSSITVDDVAMAWATPNGIRYAKHADKTAATLSNDATATSLTSEQGVVYWLSTGASGKLRRKDVDHAESPPQLLATDLVVNFGPSEQAIALTPAFVVWITSDGRVLRVPR